MSLSFSTLFQHIPRGFAFGSLVFLSGRLGFQELENGFRVGSVDLGLCHQGEGDAIVEAAEIRNLLIGAGLLSGELVAGEADDDKSLVLVLLVEGLKAVVLGGESAFGRGVDNHQDLAFELGEVHLVTLIAGGLEVVDPPVLGKNGLSHEGEHRCK